MDKPHVSKRYFTSAFAACVMSGPILAGLTLGYNMLSVGPLDNCRTFAANLKGDVEILKRELFYYCSDRIKDKLEISGETDSSDYERELVQDCFKTGTSLEDLDPLSVRSADYWNCVEDYSFGRDYWFWTDLSKR